MNVAERLPPADTTVTEFLDWAADQPGRWQLRDGEPEVMEPRSDRHGSDGTLRLESIGFEMPLREAYRTAAVGTNLA
jgi:Uma2 family endonuclease